jgi:hypothetical protein
MSRHAQPIRRPVQRLPHPPTPRNSTSHGDAARSAAMRRPPSTSPDGSPATTNTCKCASVMSTPRGSGCVDATQQAASNTRRAGRRVKQQSPRWATRSCNTPSTGPPAASAQLRRRQLRHAASARRRARDERQGKRITDVPALLRSVNAAATARVPRTRTRSRRRAHSRAAAWTRRRTPSLQLAAAAFTHAATSETQKRQLTLPAERTTPATPLVRRAARSVARRPPAQKVRSAGTDELSRGTMSWPAKTQPPVLTGVAAATSCVYARVRAHAGEGARSDAVVRRQARARVGVHGDGARDAGAERARCAGARAGAAGARRSQRRACARAGRTQHALQQVRRSAHFSWGRRMRTRRHARAADAAP